MEELRTRLLPLAQWAAKFKREENRCPQLQDVPPNLAHLWSEFQSAKSALPGKAAAAATEAPARLNAALPTKWADACASPPPSAQLLSPSRRAARPIVASAMRHVQARRDAAAAAATTAAASGSNLLIGFAIGQPDGGGSPGSEKENQPLSRAGAAASANAAAEAKGLDFSKAAAAAPWPGTGTRGGRTGTGVGAPMSTPLRGRGSMPGGMRSPFGRRRAGVLGDCPQHEEGEEDDEVPPTPLSAVRGPGSAAKGPAGISGGGGRPGLPVLAALRSPAAAAAPTAPGAGGTCGTGAAVAEVDVVADSVVKATPPVSSLAARRRSRGSLGRSLGFGSRLGAAGEAAGEGSGGEEDDEEDDDNGGGGLFGYGLCVTAGGGGGGLSGSGRVAVAAAPAAVATKPQPAPLFTDTTTATAPTSTGAAAPAAKAAPSGTGRTVASPGRRLARQLSAPRAPRHSLGGPATATTVATASGTATAAGSFGCNGLSRLSRHSLGAGFGPSSDSSSLLAPAATAASAAATAAAAAAISAPAARNPFSRAESLRAMEAQRRRAAAEAAAAAAAAAEEEAQAVDMRVAGMVARAASVSAASGRAAARVSADAAAAALPRGESGRQHQQQPLAPAARLEAPPANAANGSAGAANAAAAAGALGSGSGAGAGAAVPLDVHVTAASPFSPLTKVLPRRRLLATATAGNGDGGASAAGSGAGDKAGGNVVASFGALLAAHERHEQGGRRHQAAAAAAAGGPGAGMGGAYGASGGAGDDTADADAADDDDDGQVADDVLMRQQAEGYHALAAEADAALMLRRGAGGAAAAAAAAAAGGAAGGAGAGPGDDAQAEMRRLVLREAVQEVDMDGLALLGPEAAEAAGVTAGAVAPVVAAAATAVAGREAELATAAVVAPKRRAATAATARTTADVIVAAGVTAGPSRAGGASATAGWDVAFELLPAAVREEVARRRQQEAKAAEAAVAPQRPAAAEVAAASSAAERGDASAAAATAATAAAKRRRQLKAQLLSGPQGGGGPESATATPAPAAAKATAVPKGGRRAAASAGAKAVAAAARRRTQATAPRTAAADVPADGPTAATEVAPGAAAAKLPARARRAALARQPKQPWHEQQHAVATEAAGAGTGAGAQAASEDAMEVEHHVTGGPPRALHDQAAGEVEVAEVDVEAGARAQAAGVRGRGRRAAAVAAAARLRRRPPACRVTAADGNDRDAMQAGSDNEGEDEEEEESATSGGGSDVEMGCSSSSDSGSGSDMSDGGDEEEDDDAAAAEVGSSSSSDEEDRGGQQRQRSAKGRGAAATAAARPRAPRRLPPRAPRTAAATAGDAHAGETAGSAAAAAEVEAASAPPKKPRAPARQSVGAAGAGAAAGSAAPKRALKAAGRGGGTAGSFGAGGGCGAGGGAGAVGAYGGGGGGGRAAASAAFGGLGLSLPTGDATSGAAAATPTGASAGGTADPSGAGGPAPKPPAPAREARRTIRDAGNFVKMASSGSRPKHSFGFAGRSAASGRALKASQTRKRRIINGKVVITGGKAPGAAGQGADFLEGFGGGSRCFKCGGTGHWARDCPGTAGLGSPSKRAAGGAAAASTGGGGGAGAGLAAATAGGSGAGPSGKAPGASAAAATGAAGATRARVGGGGSEGFGGGGMYVMSQGRHAPAHLAALAASHPAEPLNWHALLPDLIPAPPPAEADAAGPSGASGGGGSASDGDIPASTGADADAGAEDPKAATADGMAAQQATTAPVTRPQQPVGSRTFSSEDKDQQQQEDWAGSTGPVPLADAAVDGARSDAAAMQVEAPPCEEGGKRANGGVPAEHVVAAGATPEPAAAATTAQPAQQPPTQPVPAVPQQLTHEAAAALSDEALGAALRTVWGHAGFRGRQLEVVRAVLGGRSMLAVLPTGAGKSLTYQLPAILMPGVTLVVSPLLALMDDQLSHLPPLLRGRGACLSGQQSRQQVESALQAAARGAVKLLYVAPEKLLTPWLLAAIRGLDISLIAVDEAHCVAEWGHSFRPAYLRLGYVLRHVLRPRCVLGLTATATAATAAEVAAVLGLAGAAGAGAVVAAAAAATAAPTVAPTSGPASGATPVIPTSTTPYVIKEPPLRSNLRLKVVHVPPGSGESGRSRQLLLSLLRAPAPGLGGCGSVLVYVSMQWQADELAGWLQSNAGIAASSYHAGRPLHERSAVAASFLSGATRVVVATVAFGMGVDHPAIGGVVWMQMPRSLEEYVQQAGRAGRDGREALCCMILDNQDYLRFRSLAFSNACELGAVEKFLDRVFSPRPLLQLGAGGSSGSSKSSFGVLQLSSLAEELDLPEEAAESLMSYLQQGQGEVVHAGAAGAGAAGAGDAGGGGYAGGGYVSVLPSCAARVHVYFHRCQPAALARSWPVVAALLATKPRVHRGCYKLDMAALVAAAPGGGMSSSQALRQLAQLAGLGQIHFEPQAGAKNRCLAWQLLRPPPPESRGGLRGLAAALHARLCAQTAAAAGRLDLVWGLMAGAWETGGPSDAGQEAFLRPRVTAYFDDPHSDLLLRVGAGALGGGGAGTAAPMPPPPAAPPGCPPLPLAGRSERVKLEVEATLTANRARLSGPSAPPLSATAVARLLHGLVGPAFPADAWRKAPGWGSLKTHDWSYVRAVAAHVLAARQAREAARDREAREQRKRAREADGLVGDGDEQACDGGEITEGHLPVVQGQQGWVRAAQRPRLGIAAPQQLDAEDVYVL